MNYVSVTTIMGVPSAKEANIRWLTVGEGVVFRTGPSSQPGVEVQKVAEEDMRVPYDKRLVRIEDGRIEIPTQYGWLSRTPDQKGKNGFLR